MRTNSPDVYAVGDVKSKAFRQITTATADGTIAGCVAVDIFWGDQAEIRSLAVSEGVSGQGVGAMLIGACKKDAAELGIGRLFAMTYVQEFFEKQGFRQVDIMTLPEKVWRECLEWYAKGHRHETAMIIDLDNEEDDR